MLRAHATYESDYLLGTSIARPLIAKAQVDVAHETGADAVAHGATGKGNDQVRFDLSIQSLGDYEIIAPIRDIQKQHTHVRKYEQEYLEQRGFAVPLRHAG